MAKSVVSLIMHEVLLKKMHNILFYLHSLQLWNYQKYPNKDWIFSDLISDVHNIVILTIDFNCKNNDSSEELDISNDLKLTKLWNRNDIHVNEKLCWNNKQAI